MMGEPGPIWAVLSVFSPDASLLQHVDLIASQVDRVVVVEDHGPDPAETVLAELESRGVLVRRQPANLGIAAALNRGAAEAFDAGADAVVLFDQDSAPGPELVPALRETWQEARARGVAAAYSAPEFWSQVRQVAAEDASGVLLAREPIQSGTFWPRETWERLGPLREDLFIDLVDVEYALRAEAAGLQPVAAPGTRLGHRLGSAYHRPWWSGGGVKRSARPATVTLSAPFRYYYRVRNRRVVNREYARLFPRRLAVATIVELLHLLEAVAYARPRGRLLRAALRGWRDGRAGAPLGRMPDDLQAGLSEVTWSLPPLGPAAAPPE